MSDRAPDDTDRKPAQAERRAHNRLGYAVQLRGVRHMGRFLSDPRHVPAVAAHPAEHPAEQLEIAEPSRLKEKEYGEPAAAAACRLPPTGLSYWRGSVRPAARVRPPSRARRR